MKECKSKAMREMLRRGLNKAKKTRAPSDGCMMSLVYETKPNGWHYQVEYINDTRMYEKPKVVVYAFRPPRRFHARSADLFLESE